MRAAALLLITVVLGAWSPVVPGDAGRVVEWWPNGKMKMSASYDHGVRSGEYRTYHVSGAPYELRHYVNGREQGLQQSWTADGELYLNYEVRNGRRYGLVNAKPCVTAGATDAALPYYESADFTPHWTSSSPHAVGDFALTTQTGAAVTRANLAGRIHIANFMFTRCTTICPAVTANLKRVQAAIDGKDIVLVSYSVTPDQDPADLLAAYGSRRGIDPSKWLLVTGDRDQIYRLARESYFADDGRVRRDDEILHSEKVLLVDREGRLRGVYNGTLPFEIEKLIEDVKTLKNN